MQDNHVPVIGRQYWTVFTVAALFGSNAGDLLSKYLSPGDPQMAYLPFLALTLVAIIVAEHYSKSGSHAWYWMAVAVIPMASNDMAAFLAVHFGLRRIWLIAILTVVLILTLVTLRSPISSMIATTMMDGSRRPVRPMTDTAYWVAMVQANALGSLASDFCTLALRFDLGDAALVLSALLCATFCLHLFPRLNRHALYWLTVVVISAVGTAVGRFLAYGGLLHNGLPVSVLLSGILLLGLLLIFGRHNRA